MQRSGEKHDRQREEQIEKAVGRIEFCLYKDEQKGH